MSDPRTDAIREALIALFNGARRLGIDGAELRAAAEAFLNNEDQPYLAPDQLEMAKREIKLAEGLERSLSTK